MAAAIQYPHFVDADDGLQRHGGGRFVPGPQLGSGRKIPPPGLHPLHSFRTDVADGRHQYPQANFRLAGS